MDEKITLFVESKMLLELLDSAIHGTVTFNSIMSTGQWLFIIDMARKHNVLPLIFEKASDQSNFISLQNILSLRWKQWLL